MTWDQIAAVDADQLFAAVDGLLPFGVVAPDDFACGGVEAGKRGVGFVAAVEAVEVAVVPDGGVEGEAEVGGGPEGFET
ncbi:MAG: hypothetical protein IPJ98_07330 [Bryobacterales bacterium]|nr:hypothetical protein [Bryobacterales bacterium]